MTPEALIDRIIISCDDLIFAPRKSVTDSLERGINAIHQILFSIVKKLSREAIYSHINCCETTYTIRQYVCKCHFPNTLIIDHLNQYLLFENLYHK